MRYAALQTAPRNTAATPFLAICSLEARHDLLLLDHRLALLVAAVVLALLAIVLKAQQHEPGIE